MAFIATENVAQVELRFFAAGQQVENTLYFYNPDGVGLAGLIDITDQVGEWWDLHIQPLQGGGVTVLEIYGTDLTAQDAATYTNLEKEGMTGGATATPILPGNATICVSFRTVGRGRSARGRNYFIGLTEGVVTENTVGSVTVSAIEDAYNALITHVTPPWQWIVLSRYHNGAPRAEGLIQPVIAALCVDPYVDSQRRRLTGRGT